ncbi:hypothetical protein [Nostoc sp. GT001]|uniref:hypothetical protein n=1 Tax=Nostoc sp. GT001 TaxID=3056647 RepID=UPI0025AA33CE|nr:hypothetical protein [Nostoc sp. GT001]MDM9583534.1 hypothetical protein [Nostoc sp. GT001]
MISIETLFLRTLADIEQRLSVQDPYEILLIAGLIRKLFLDDHPLVDRVNATHKLKLNFEITALMVLPPSIPPPMLWSIQDGLDPNTSPPFTKRQTVSRDKFFKTVVTIVNQHEYSIREVVLFEANVVGAVHAGSPKKEKEHVLHEVDCHIAVGGYASSLRQLLAIARVILKTLEPLRDAIQKS